MCKAKWIAGVSLFTLGGVLLGGYFFSKYLLEKATVSALNSLGARATLGEGEDAFSSKQVEIQSLLPTRVLIHGLKVQVKGMDLEVKSLLVSYNLFTNAVSFAVPEKEVKFSFKDASGLLLPHGNDGSEDSLSDVGEGIARFACDLGASYSMSFHKNLLLYAFQKFVLGSEAANPIARIDYIDDTEAVCTDRTEKVTAYDKGHFTVSFDVQDSRSDELQDMKFGVNAEFVRSAKEGANEGLIRIRDFVLSAYFGQGKDSKFKMKMSVPMLELDSGKFSVSVKGRASISEECMLYSLGKCDTDLVFKVKNVEALLSSFDEGIRFLEEDSELRSLAEKFQIFTGVVRGIAHANTDNTKDGVTTFSIKSDGTNLNIGSMPLGEFLQLIYSKGKIQDLGAAVLGGIQR